MLTRDDLVRDAKTVEIALSDGRKVPVKQVWHDQLTGVAVLKIDGRGLTALPLGDSSALRVGDAAVVVGWPSAAPLRQARIRATGSATGGNLAIDAPISMDSDGGPLIDLHGQVVGIAVVEGGGAESSSRNGSAIPIDRAKALLRQALLPAAAQSQSPPVR